VNLLFGGGGGVPVESCEPAERTALEAGAARLRPLLGSFGFAYVPGYDGCSGGGPFAVSYFRRELLEIGLIVRQQAKLGCPNYSVGEGWVGHEDLLAVLGHDGRARLVPGEWPAWVAADGGDGFAALRADLEDPILPALREPPARYRIVLARAVRACRARRGR